MKKVFFVLAAMLMFGCDKEATPAATSDVVSDIDVVSSPDAGTDSVASDAVSTPAEDVTVTQSTEVTPTK